MYSYDYFSCPKCTSNNLVELGDPEDLTKADYDGVECGKCGHKWIFPEVLEDDCWLETNEVDDVYLAKGEVSK